MSGVPSRELPPVGAFRAERSFVTLDSGKRQEFETGAVRDIQEGKGRYDLIPRLPIHRLAGVYERGADKYGERNWQKGIPLGRCLDSALRHTFQLLDGDESEDHAAQAIWNLCTFIWTQEEIRQGRLPASLDLKGA